MNLKIPFDGHCKPEDRATTRWYRESASATIAHTTVLPAGQSLRPQRRLETLPACRRSKSLKRTQNIIISEKYYTKMNIIISLYPIQSLWGMCLLSQHPARIFHNRKIWFLGQMLPRIHQSASPIPTPISLVSGQLCKDPNEWLLDNPYPCHLVPGQIVPD